MDNSSSYINRWFIINKIDKEINNRSYKKVVILYHKEIIELAYRRV